ncbi:MAG: putative oxidoreductase C-terminal domain-containing protein [Mangrovibacterium sp.]
MNLPKNLLILFAVMLYSCGGKQRAVPQEDAAAFSGAKGEVKLMVLDPGHFHAALVQKTMYEQVDPTVYVYAPEGSDVQDHLAQIDGFNARSVNPTRWKNVVYTGADYLRRMLDERPGNVLVLSGNNAKKISYIKAAAGAGINIFADKPMVIDAEGFAMLEQAFQLAAEQGVLIYDIMTERYEITTVLQRELSMMPGIFGTLVDGSPEDPAITKESVHHIFKEVAGKAVTRPAWFFDTDQQGEGIVDVTTHLVDLIQWEAFPEQVLHKTDVEMLQARRWATELNPEQFLQVTRLDSFPSFLEKDVKDGKLEVFSNGEMIYRLKGKHARVSVIWNFQAPDGTGDMHYSVMRGTRCKLIVRQGAEENYRPSVYVQFTAEDAPETFGRELKQAVEHTLADRYPGLELVQLEDRLWTVAVPDRYRLGHEAHFGQVTERYLEFLKAGKMPAWEVPNMITKYYTTIRAREMALRP